MAAAADPGSPKARVEEPRGAGQGEKKERKIGLSALTALLALITGGIGLLFTFVPGWRPDPRVIQAATLHIAATERGVMLSEYARRTRQPPVERNEGCIPGNLYYVTEDLQGFKHRNTRLGHVLYDKATGHPIEGALKSVSDVATTSIRGTRPTDQSVSTEWVQWPLRNGWFWVRFELFRKGTLLDVIDSLPFRVRKTEYTRMYGGCLHRHA